MARGRRQTPIAGQVQALLVQAVGAKGGGEKLLGVPAFEAERVQPVVGDHATTAGGGGAAGRPGWVRGTEGVQPTEPGRRGLTVRDALLADERGQAMPQGLGSRDPVAAVAPPQAT